MTRVIVRRARLIRRPIYIRGKKSLIGGEGLTTGRFCRFDLDGNVGTFFVGKNCEMGDMTHIVAHEKVQIGNNVLIASKCFISDTNHGAYKGENQDAPDVIPKMRKLITTPVIIGDNVWIGENVVVLAGSVIGKGCIIGANSVISGVIDDYSIVVGNGRVIKKWNVKRKKWEKIVDD